MEGATAMIADIDSSTPLQREQAFLLYATFCGDVERTAHALNVSPQNIIDLAEKSKWNEKLKAILALKKSAHPGDIERGINRALNFVQAHRYRLFLERVITRLSLMDYEELEDYIFQKEETKMGRVSKTLSTRALADFASALEKMSAMTYQALADTAQDRAKRDEEIGGDSGGAIHAAIAKAMTEIAADQSPAAILFDAQRAAGERLKEIGPVRNPYNSEI